MSEHQMRPPTQCHLWQSENLRPEDIAAALQVVETWADDSHHSEHLCRCRTCGQLYADVWCELIDWDGGDDTTFSFYIPVQSASEIAIVKKALPPPMGLDWLAFYPRINESWEGGVRKVAWLGKS